MYQSFYYNFDLQSNVEGCTGPSCLCNEPFGFIKPHQQFYEDRGCSLVFCWKVLTISFLPPGWLHNSGLCQPQTYRESLLVVNIMIQLRWSVGSNFRIWQTWHQASKTVSTTSWSRGWRKGIWLSPFLKDFSKKYSWWYWSSFSFKWSQRRLHTEDDLDWSRSMVYDP